ncbi:methyl-accepting chemotaxis protein, partial [Telmatospirillum sp.]|uniref:methyl-accepting chemotaxis protein n=1 Tax=Telmatospirillum sp. TaxID=2079197 RepID=UPI002845FAA9
MSYKNWPIIWKVVSLLLLLGAVSLGGAYYATLQFSVIDDINEVIIVGPAAAATNNARAGRFVMAAQSAIYQNIVATTEEGNRAATRDREAAIAGFDEQMAIERKAVPSHADKIDAITRQFRSALTGACGDVIRVANESTTAEGNAKAAALMEKDCKPALADTIKSIAVLTDSLMTERDRLNAEANVVVQSSTRTTLGVIAGAIIGIVVLAVFLVRSGVVAPVRESLVTMAALGRGELAVPITGTSRGDEVGAIAKSLETLRGQLQEAENQRQAQKEREATERQLIVRREALAKEFVERMQDLAAGFAKSSGEVADAAKNLSATAEETSRQAQSVAAAAEEAATNVQTVAASSEEMAASVREITGQVGHSAKVADTAFTEAEASNARIGA